MAGLIAMISVFIVVSIEMIFSTMNGGAMGCHSGPGGVYDPLSPSPPLSEARLRDSDAGISIIITHGDTGGGGGLGEVVSGGQGIRMSTPRHRRSSSIGTQLQKIEGPLDSTDFEGVLSSSSEDLRLQDTDQLLRTDEDDIHSKYSSDSEDSEANATPGGSRTPNGRTRPRSDSGHRHIHGAGTRLTESQQQQKNLMQVVLLEAGILFHSVFIGMLCLPSLFKTLVLIPWGLIPVVESD